MTIAKCLKMEVGAATHVFYIKPIEDPNVYLHGHREVFEDGSVVESPFSLLANLMNIPWLPRQLISGGQTGADRAALDFACFNRIPMGVGVPAGDWRLTALYRPSTSCLKRNLQATGSARSEIFRKVMQL